MELEDLPNLGEIICKNLRKANINTAEELRKVGSKEAFLRILVIDNTACLNMLYALEGAVQNIRWHYLDDKTKKELKEFYQNI
jgi:DNA transformation protein